MVRPKCAESYISHISDIVLQPGQFTPPTFEALKKTQIKFRKHMQTSLYLNLVPQ